MIYWYQNEYSLLEQTSAHRNSAHTARLVSIYRCHRFHKFSARGPRYRVAKYIQHQVSRPRKFFSWGLESEFPARQESILFTQLRACCCTFFQDRSSVVFSFCTHTTVLQFSRPSKASAGFRNSKRCSPASVWGEASDCFPQIRIRIVRICSAIRTIRQRLLGLLFYRITARELPV